MKQSKKLLKLVFILLGVTSVLNFIVAESEEETIERVLKVETLRPSQAGTYFVKASLGVEDNIEEYIKVHVKYPKTVLNYDLQEGIDAHDIVVKTGSFNKQEKEGLIRLGNAHAWSMKDGGKINNVNVSVNNPKRYSGTLYNIDYFTDNNTTVNVNVFEQDKISLNLEEVYMKQASVIEKPFEFISLLVLTLMVLPLLLLMVVFLFLSYLNHKTGKLLFIKDNTG